MLGLNHMNISLRVRCLKRGDLGGVKSQRRRRRRNILFLLARWADYGQEMVLY